MIQLTYYHKFAIIGFSIGIFPVITGILGLTTSTWISIHFDNTSHPIVYDLFGQCSGNRAKDCLRIETFENPQYFAIIGLIVFIIGLLVAVILTAGVTKHKIHYISPTILMIGTIMIFISLIFFIQNAVLRHGTLPIVKLQIGSGMALMISSCSIGCFLTGYFAFTAGYIHRYIVSNVNTS